MLLSPYEADLFFKLHRALMVFVNQRLGVVSDISSPEEFAALAPETRLKVREAFLEELDLIESFVDENSANLGDEEMDILLSWRQPICGSFYMFRQLKNYTVFLSSDDPPIAYGVVALTDPFERLMGPYLPVLTEAVLLPFKDKIIYDGLLSSYNITFGGGVKRRLNDSYRQAKQRMGIVTSLPIQSIPISPAMTKKKPKPKKKKAVRSGPKAVKQALETILALTDIFCHERLNGEYAQLCRSLSEKLSRKRPSPLLRGKPKTWACGVIRTIGWVNFLDDPNSHPYVRLTAIDKALGVGQSTGQAKSRDIRKMLKIQPFDMDWTLPSRMDDNPRIWMLEVDGFIIDMRYAPRDLQEIAFENGVIPYIPAKGNTGAVNDDDDRGAAESSGLLYQFKITLKRSRPAIWRRILINDCTLDKLHEHIQTSMGWTNSHLHQFKIEDVCFGDPNLMDDGLMDSDYVDSTVTMISDMMPEDGGRYRFLYEYDFGDSWEHQVLFEGSPQAEPGQQFPLCLEGQRACPPEDIGGVWGYEEFLVAMADPNHEQHEGLLQWIGPFDPEAFDADQATRQMRQGLPAWR